MTLRRVVFICALLQFLSVCKANWIVKSKNTEDAEVPKSESGREQRQDIPVEYGADVSFPMHHNPVSTNYPWLDHNAIPGTPTPEKYKDMVLQPLGDRDKFYHDFMKGCASHNGKNARRCQMTEDDRIAMTLRQPQSMQNYTRDGYKKIKAPPEVWKLITEFWEKNKNNKKLENWGAGNTYTNNWEAPTYMVSVEDSGLRGGGAQLKQAIWNAARDTIQEWTGEELTQCSLYGIRIYEEGAVLASHVDRLPLVSSAIINVAQDLDEPWPLEVIGHDGKAKNVTMEPGDMVLYESHSVIHGRPFALKGRYYANVFVHFEPTGHTLRHHNVENKVFDVDRQYRESIARGVGGHESSSDEGLPPYVIPNTPEAKHYKDTHAHQKPKKQETFTTGSTPVHLAAQKGDLSEVRKLVEKKKDSVHEKDANGWTALHESARGGHIDVVKYLIDQGADANATTSTGGTVLYWAKKTHEEDHPVIEFLESIGALDAGPDL